MDNRRYVVAYGDLMERSVSPAPENESGDFLTKEEAARRIVVEMDGVIILAKRTRNRAMRILRAERKKGGAA
ncbi:MULTISPECIES: hypothetical protein [unclassified Agrobacterium]|uniref:hypothetical protein n=1 Tax=unclassified Agrobacterium TaxID=2632611 RepID=UPI0024476424|nr:MULTISPECIES: hypothetical protein [unclassified Agrobacterium]MDH0612319.1 hypothetical protein [Agrobacterium sp. GD03872]MDH0696216.1 hypothetical protein [Agrobacterium sp. GD03871]MDH1059118.1 hypothetical protein [Agrobacterium sp. GD03992]MDH2210479.1 hypothetical protein [Agrobacterium sp. GD03643]MDH2217984.1 hypothetical protein [Agrobacterium sp. GD03638]